MILSTKQLKAFKAASAGIKQNNIFPVCSYLKFEPGTITKNNLESFVIMEADVSDTMLIDERLLMSMVDSTKSDTITATVKDDTVILSDGLVKKISPTEPVINFPVNDASDLEYIDIPAPVLYAVRSASQFTVENPNMPYTECVFIGKGLVSASNNFTAYGENVAGNLPEIILLKDAAAAISKFESIEFAQTETYQFFKSGALRYGFGKKETKFLDMTKHFIIPDGTPVSINKTEIIDFCNQVLTDCAGRPIVASITNFVLSMVDSAYKLDIQQPLTATLEDFNFNPNFMRQLLKALPDENVTFIKSLHKCHVTGQSGFVSLIMEHQKLTA